MRGDEILGQMGKDFTGQPANTLEDLLGGFGAAADDMFAHIDNLKWSSESVRQSVSGTAGLAITTSTTTMATAMT